jgi:hypothetical protein
MLLEEKDGMHDLDRDRRALGDGGRRAALIVAPAVI